MGNLKPDYDYGPRKHKRDSHRWCIDKAIVLMVALIGAFGVIYGSGNGQDFNNTVEVVVNIFQENADDSQATEVVISFQNTEPSTIDPAPSAEPTYTATPTPSSTATYAPTTTFTTTPTLTVSSLPCNLESPITPYNSEELIPDWRNAEATQLYITIPDGYDTLYVSSDPGVFNGHRSNVPLMIFSQTDLVVNGISFNDYDNNPDSGDGHFNIWVAAFSGCDFQSIADRYFPNDNPNWTRPIWYISNEQELSILTLQPSS